jgi:paraquat-inducible protein A
MRPDTYIACRDCDLLHRRRPLPSNGTAVCTRCGAQLYRSKPKSLDRTLAMALSGIVFCIIANIFPFLSLEFEGQLRETTLITGIVEFYRQGMPWMSALVLTTGILFPAFELTGLIYLLLPLKLNRIPWKMAAVFRLILSLQPWGMTEVFLLGILVCMFKLAQMATIIPGIALYAFLVLMFVVAATAASLDPDILWERIEIRT